MNLSSLAKWLAVSSLMLWGFMTSSIADADPSPVSFGATRTVTVSVSAGADWSCTNSIFGTCVDWRPGTARAPLNYTPDSGWVITSEDVSQSGNGHFWPGSPAISAGGTPSITKQQVVHAFDLILKLANAEHKPKAVIDSINADLAKRLAIYGTAYDELPNTFSTVGGCDTGGSPVNRVGCTVNLDAHLVLTYVGTPDSGELIAQLVAQYSL